MLTKVLALVLVVLIGLALGVETARYVHTHATGVDGPRAAALSFSGMGIPAGAIRTWDGQRADLDAVTQQVSQGIQAYAEAIASGRTAIDDFFSAPVSGFGDGVELRVTLRSGARQVVMLDRWD